MAFAPGVDAVMDPMKMIMTTGQKDPIGGQQKLGVGFVIGHNGRIDPSVNWVTVRIREEKDDTTDPTHPIEHPFAQNHVDYTFDLSSPSWRKIAITQPQGGGDAFVVPGAVETMGCPKDPGPDDPLQFYMYWTQPQAVNGDTSHYTNVGWNTTGPQSSDPDDNGPLPLTTLLGHNGKHTIHIVGWGGTKNNQPWSVRESDDGSQSLGAFPFQQSTDGQNWSAQTGSSGNPQQLDRNVQNLAITKLQTTDGKLDIVRYDPTGSDSSLQNPSLSCDFTDGTYQSGDVYKYLVTLQETGTPSVSYTPQTLPQGPPAPFSIPMPSDLIRGVYGFDVEISKWRNGMLVDLQSWRSSQLCFSSTDIDDAGQFHYRIVPQSEQSSDGLPLSQFQAQAVASDLSLGGVTNGQGQDLTISASVSPDHVVAAPDPKSEGAGAARVVATGVDDEGVTYRAHRNKRLLPLNTHWLDYKVYLLNGPNLPSKNLEPNGGQLQFDWSQNHRFGGTGCGFWTRLPDAQHTKAWFSFELENAPIGLYPPPLHVDTPTPKDIWEDIQSKAEQNWSRGGAWSGLRPNPTLVHVFSHGDVTSMEVSSVKPSNSDLGAAWISQILDQRSEQHPYEYYLLDAPPWHGVASFHAQSCASAGEAKGATHNYDALATQSSRTNPAPFVVLNNGVNNSVGYQNECFPNDFSDDRFGAQAWYNCVYRVGIGGKDPSTGVYYNFTAKSSLLAAEANFSNILASWGASDGKNYDMGAYNQWVITYPSTPLVDYH